MKISNLLGALAVFLVATSSAAKEFPIEAKTADGKTIMLYEDGTWRPKAQQRDGSVIRKSQAATTKVSSRFDFYEFRYDPSTWTPQAANETFSHLFSHKSEEAWCGIIPERIGMTQEALTNAILTNLKANSTNGKMVQKSKAMVNGIAGETIELQATVDGFFITYYVFSFSGAKGTAQLSCWTGQGLLDEYRDSFNTFYRGFILKD